MSHIRHIRRLADALAGLAGAVLAFAAAAPAPASRPAPLRVRHPAEDRNQGEHVATRKFPMTATPVIRKPAARRARSASGMSCSVMIWAA